MNSPQILIVDDTKMSRDLIKQLLAPLHPDFQEASNGQMAIEMLSEFHDYDLIITDIDMPVLDGIGLCQKINNATETASIPVIILSMFDSEQSIERGFEAGADAYITKRTIRDSLFPTVNEQLSKAILRKNCLVMVVDDSKVVRLSIQSFLEEQGFRVITAENGREALVHMQNKVPDIILSDNEMPIMDGVSFLKAVRTMREYDKTPFIAMSIHDEQGHMKRFVQYGASAYITKPFNFNQLAILIERILSDQFLLQISERQRLEMERSAMLASITSLVTALEARDAYTKGHSETVAQIVTGMLTEINANEELISQAVIGARLHDIGKIGVRDETLFKPGVLSESDWNQIKRHPEIGAEILKSVPSLNEILPIVLYHHERFDGGGYPEGLKGEAIPFLARITAVADTFSALTENRPYRKGMLQEHALQVLRELAGSQLCPESIETFFRWFAKCKMIASNGEILEQER